MLIPLVNSHPVRRILIVKLSAIGDILHALPVSSAIGQTFPDVELYWAVEEPFKTLLEGNPYLKGIIPFPKLNSKLLLSPEARRDYLDRLHALKAYQFDAVLDLQGLTKSAIIVRASGARLKLGYHWQRELAKYINTPVPRRPESVHIVDQYLDVAQYVVENLPKVTFPFHISPEDDSAVLQLLKAEGIDPKRPFVSLNPASAAVIKQWGTDHYAGLINTLHAEGIPSVLVTADRAVAEAVAAKVEVPFANLVGKTSLKQLGAVLKHSAVHVCGDTGSGHLATALERPVISLIGPTDPDRACPYGQRENVISHREACSASCTWHKCAYAVPHCMQAITEQEVVAKILAIVKSC